MVITFSPEGAAACLYTEAIELARLGDLRIRRASHVEPTSDGRWQVQIVDGPCLGVYTKRSEALAAEAAWLEDRL